MARVTVDGGPSGGMLDAWIDFNVNGVFDHPAEHLWDGPSQSLSSGANNLTFAIPDDAAIGQTYARFRLSSRGGLLPKFYAPDGEVEDYLVETKEQPQTGTITIVKQSDPADGTDFTFTGDLGDFTLDDADTDDNDGIDNCFL